MKRMLLMVALVLATTDAGCFSFGGPAASTPSPHAKKLLGKWQTTLGGTMEFHPDGRLTMAGPNGSVDVNYTVRGNILQMKKVGAANGIAFTLESVTIEEVVVVDGDGQKMTLQRVN